MTVKNLLEEAQFEILAGRYDAAERFLRKALEKEPNNTEVLYNLALVYELLRNRAEALKYFKRVLELDPDHPEARKHAERLTEF